MANVKVSIIIPCYNALPFLKETLANALEQTYPHLEVIVIDDGSTDGSFEYVQSLEYPNLALYKNQGKGACAARNYGFQQSSGDYIQFLDADDLLSPDKIATQVAAFEQAGPRAIASCRWQHFIEQPGDLQEKEKQLIDKSYDHPIDWLLDSWNGGGMGQTGIWLTPRRLIEEAGGWDESLLKNQDGEFVCRVLLNASGILFSSGCVVYYRQPGKTNVSQGKSEKAIESLLKSYKLYEKVLACRDDNTVRSALAKNYNNFIYLYHNTHADLSKKAEESVKDLRQQVRIPFSNKVLKIFSRFIGWKKSLKIRNFLKGY